MSLQITQTQTPSTTTAAPPVPAGDVAPASGGFSLDGFLGDMSATSAAASRSVPGQGGYVYQQFSDGTITIAAGPAKVGTSYAPGTPINVAITKEIGPFPTAAAPAPTAPTVPAAPPPATGLVPSLDAILAGIGETVAGIGATVTGIGQTISDGIGGMVDGVSGFVGGLFGSSPEEAAPGAPAAETPIGAAPGSDEPATPAPTTPVPEGATNNLDVTERLAEDTEVAHGYDQTVAGDVTGGARREAILAGDLDALKTIKCSEFTTMAIAESGYDLRQDFKNPADGLPVGYLDTDGGVTFVTLYAVSNNIDVALAAILDVQNGGGTCYTKGSKEALALKSSKNNKMWSVPADGEKAEVVWESVAPAARDTDFWVAANTDVTKTEFAEGQKFGAGVVAEQLGGAVVELVDRKPGDVQQWMKTTDGKTNGSGHSSTVYSVRGGGVALLDGVGNPKLVDGSGAPLPTDGIAAGWYRVDGSSRCWEVGPDTDPARVAELTVTEVQLLDANQKGTANETGAARGSDATQVGSFADATTFSDEGASMLTCAGRLPTSSWNAWKKSTQKEAPLP